MFSIFKINEYLHNFCSFGIKGGEPKQSAPTTQNMESKPWEAVQPHLQNVFNEAKDIYYNDRPQYFPDDTYLPYSQDTMQGLDQMRGLSNNNQLVGAATNDATKTLSGNYLNSNPYLDSVIKNTAGDITRNVGSSFAAGGRYGSNAMASTLADSIGDMSSSMRMGNYQNERDNMARYQALAPQNNALQYDPANQMMNVGSILEAKDYEALNSDINRFNFNENSRSNALNQYNSLLNNGLQFGTQTGVSTQPVYGGSKMQGALGAGMAGYGLANSGMLGAGAAGMAGPVGIGAAVLGGLFS